VRCVGLLFPSVLRFGRLVRLVRSFVGKVAADLGPRKRIYVLRPEPSGRKVGGVLFGSAYMDNWPKYCVPQRPISIRTSQKTLHDPPLKKEEEEKDCPRSTQKKKEKKTVHEYSFSASFFFLISCVAICVFL
jgi:hypothetical protein